MSGQTSFVTALYGAVLAGAGGGAARSSYVVLEWPGLPIDPQQYGNLWATDNQSGSPEALEAISELVDDNLPLLSPAYQPSGISLESIYALILEATVGSAAGGASPLARAFATAREVFESAARGSLADPLLKFHPSYPQPRTWCDPAGAPLWTTMRIGGGAAPPPPLPESLRVLLERPGLSSWRIAAAPTTTIAARPTSGVAAAASVAQGSATPPGSAATVRSITALRDMRATATTLRPLELQPGHPAVSAPPTVLKRLQKSPVVLHTPPPPVREQPVMASQLTASFQYLRVSVQRRWLETTLFHLPGWSLGGIAPGLFSDGTTQGNAGIFPLLPVEFVAVKQIRIAGAWSESDKQAASAALSTGHNASFGPFTLSGGNAIRGTFDGSSLTLPGIQVIAWLCTPVPFLPPRQ